LGIVFLLALVEYPYLPILGGLQRITSAVR